MKRLKSVIHTGLLYALMMVLALSQPLNVHAQEAPVSDTPTQTETPAPAKIKESDEARWRKREKKVETPVETPVITPTDDGKTGATDSPQPATSQPGGDAAIDSNVGTSTTTNVNTNTSVNNTLQSSANSGNASVIKNTTAGNATSGDAQADTTIINTLHSSVQGNNAGIAHFTADVYGNINGDITLYPAIENASVNASTVNDSALNVNNNNAINNDITLSASSGDATVAGNTTAGSATSGDAHTVANLVNLINSIIAANKSFIGTINIHGSLNGDILISPEFIPQLLASNGGSVDSSIENNLTANLTNNSTIINNIALNANSGNATVSKNTTAGSATTGDAQTNLTVLNLTGREIVAKNSMLVFVNVLGTWVGVIAEAPVGATAAALGNGVTSDIVNNQAVNATNNNTITNNLTLASQSGDASVLRNTTAGNATTGNATASANILNIDTSSFSLTDWFGVLFINVFGVWNGSFGVDTESGNVVALGGMAVQPPTPQSPSMRFGFKPDESSMSTTALPLSGAQPNNPTAVVETAMATLASAKGATYSKDEQVQATLPTLPKAPSNIPFLVTSGLLVAFPTLAMIAFLRRRLNFM